MMQWQLDTLNDNIEKLIEQVRIANNYRFGKHTETLKSIEGQLSFFDEAEAVCDEPFGEPSAEEVLPAKHWKKEFSFKFRGITKERGMSKILVFSLDEPQIIIGKKYKNHPDVEKESNQPFGFVKYKTDTGQENKPENNGIVCAYPEEWMKRRIGINYFIREQRDSMINAITEEDIEETGVVVENPVIGYIPSRQEIVNELEELLMTM